MTKQSRHDLLVILEYIYLNFYMENFLAFKLLKKLSTGTPDEFAQCYLLLLYGWLILRAVIGQFQVRK